MFVERDFLNLMWRRLYKIGFCLWNFLIDCICLNFCQHFYTLCYILQIQHIQAHHQDNQLQSLKNIRQQWSQHAEKQSKIPKILLNNKLGRKRNCLYIENVEIFRFSSQPIQGQQTPRIDQVNQRECNQSQGIIRRAKGYTCRVAAPFFLAAWIWLLWY